MEKYLNINLAVMEPINRRRSLRANSERSFGNGNINGCQRRQSVDATLSGSGRCTADVIPRRNGFKNTSRRHSLATTTVCDSGNREVILVNKHEKPSETSMSISAEFSDKIRKQQLKPILKLPRGNYESTSDDMQNHGIATGNTRRLTGCYRLPLKTPSKCRKTVSFREDLVFKKFKLLPSASVSLASA